METLGYYTGQGYDQAGWITGQVACRKCSANLTGQHIGGRCPQCGTPVGLSVYGDLLRYADPTYLKAVRTGLLTVFWGFIIMIGIALLMGVAGGAIGVRRGGNIDDMRSVQIAGQFIGLLGALVIAWGTWMMTSPDPSGLGEAKYGGVRKFVRVCVIVGLAKSVFDLGVSFSRMELGSDMFKVSLVVGVAMGVLQLVAFIAQIYYISQLATRVPDPNLAGRGRTIMWGVGISYGVILLVGLIAIAMGVAVMANGARPSASAGSQLMMIGCFAGIAGIALIVFGIMYLVLLWQMASRVEQSYAMATTGGQVVAPPTAGYGQQQAYPPSGYPQQGYPQAGQQPYGGQPPYQQP